ASWRLAPRGDGGAMHPLGMPREVLVARPRACLALPGAIERLDSARLRVVAQPRLAREADRVAERLLRAGRIAERVEADAPELERCERGARIAPMARADLVVEARGAAPISLRRRALRFVEELLCRPLRVVVRRRASSLRPRARRRRCI